MSTARHSSPAFRASVNDRLKTQANTSGRPFNQLQREFVLQRFLARVFADPDSPWILKGGAGLLVRLPGARFSEDLDLFHPRQNLETALHELQQLNRVSGGDPFSFQLRPPVKMTGGVIGAHIKVDAYLGTTLFNQFPVDLSTELSFVGQVERQRPRPVVEVPDLDPLPEFTLYPLPDQIADKVCAMYERHGATATPSSRFRDLVDLVLITAAFELDAERTTAALRAESDRRGLSLPPALEAPGPAWVTQYRSVARNSTLAKEMHELPAALRAAAVCLDPLLGGEVTTGVWSPQHRQWKTVAAEHE